MAAATIPFLPGLSGSRIFYIRDLTMFFRGYHVWLRRELLSGTFPLWDPYVGAGQSAFADAPRQMFLLPALAVRLVGSEVFSFNLWVASPFPLAALGAWLFFRRRFSAYASALGAIAFSVSGPIVSTANFPNLSWSVAAMPWLLWAVDRLAAAPAPRAVGVLAVATAFQALAGEPVTLFATLVLVVAFALIVATPGPGATIRGRLQYLGLMACGIGLGLGLAAVQLVPLGRAATLSERAGAVANDFWSLHPVAILETVSLHLFGDFYTAQYRSTTPWFSALNSGRDPFLFSLYFGVPLLALAVFGFVSKRPGRWGRFWTASGAASLICAFGGHTPVYPFVRDHLPLLAAFRYPAKYMVVSSMVIAAGAAAGWDAIAVRNEMDGGLRAKRARFAAIGLALVIGAVACAAAGACMYFPQPTAFRLYASARALGSPYPAGAVEFMFRTLPRQASVVLLMAAATAALLWKASATGKAGAAPRLVLGGLIVVDVIVHAWGINPAMDRAYLAQPAWLSYTRAHPDARVYIGSKRDATLDSRDLDSSGPVQNPPGLNASAGRAVVDGHINFEPSGWRVREMLSEDLAALWPRSFATATKRFFAADRRERDRFLDRTGVRYRVLPPRQVTGHPPLTRLPYLVESYLYDWGNDVSPRVAVIPDVRVIPDADRQVETLFLDGWNANAVALVERELPAAGTPGQPPALPSATIVTDGPNRVVVAAGAGTGGGYLVMLDTYSDDWHVRVDGQPASMVRANGLFRAVRLVMGPHTVEFVYRPRALLTGLAASTGALLILVALAAWPVRRTLAAPSRVGY
jgi:hypothetical protein